MNFVFLNHHLKTVFWGFFPELSTFLENCFLRVYGKNVFPKLTLNYTQEP